jgi:peptidoglycan-N-acetylglucosamine deacetylase
MSRYYITSTAFLVLFLVSLSLKGIFPISIYWFIALVIVYLLANGVGSFYLSAQYFVKVLSTGDNKSQAIAITFDDGPMAGKTNKILDVLQRHQVAGAFFCIGYRIRQNEELTKRMHNEGHLIGNHSYWHRLTFDWQSTSKIKKELADTDKAIHETIGHTPKFFRPPFGVTNPMVARAVQQRNYTVIGWSVRSFDTVTKDKEKLLRRVTKRLKAGDIVLFHDHSDSMLAILPDFIKHVSKVGLKIVRLDELIKVKTYA